MAGESRAPRAMSLQRDGRAGTRKVQSTPKTTFVSSRMLGARFKVWKVHWEDKTLVSTAPVLFVDEQVTQAGTHWVSSCSTVSRIMGDKAVHRTACDTA